MGLMGMPLGKIPVSSVNAPRPATFLPPAHTRSQFFWTSAALAQCTAFTLHLHSVWAQVQGGKFPLPSRAGGYTSAIPQMEKQARLFLGNCIF